MLFIMRFHKQIFSAALPVFEAINEGREGDAARLGFEMAGVTLKLAQQADSKSHNALIGGNDQIYATLAQIALAFTRAGQTLAQSAVGPKGFDPHRIDRAAYYQGIEELGHAKAMLESSK